MITKAHVNRLYRILTHGSWNSQAEFILDAFTKNSNMQSTPPHKFIHLNSSEYHMIMEYGLSEIAKLTRTSEPDIDKSLPESAIDEIVKIAQCDKKRLSTKRSYVSIWEKPLSDIENSLTFQEKDENVNEFSINEFSIDEDDHMLSSKKQRAFFNFATKKDDSVMFVHPLTVEKSEKMLKIILDDYEGTLVQSDHEAALPQSGIQKKTSETLAKFKTK